MLAKRSEACVMVYVLVGLCVAVVVGVGGYIFGSKYKIELHKRDNHDEEDDNSNDGYDDHNRR